MNTTLLIHLDYGENEHGYVLYRVPENKLADAKNTASNTINAWDTNDRQGFIEESIEAALKQAGIPFETESYEALYIIA